MFTADTPQKEELHQTSSKTHPTRLQVTVRIWTRLAIHSSSLWVKLRHPKRDPSVLFFKRPIFGGKPQNLG